LGVAFDSTATTPSAGQHDPVGFEVALGRLSLVVDEAARSRRGSWLDRVRAGLVAFLGFLDDEPRCGALLLVKVPHGEEVAGFREEQRVLGVLTGLLDEGAPQVAGELSSEPSSLTSELVAGGVLAVVRERMRAEDGERLVELAPSLMAFIAVRYLGQAAASAELAGVTSPEPTVINSPRLGAGGLATRLTRRTRLVLQAIAAAPRSSNRAVARAAGLCDEGQASRLLRRLHQRGLIANVGAGAAHGEPNAWLLTAEGRRMLRLTGGMARAARPARGDVAGGGRIA
jgi:hypothetical protein